MCLAYFVYAHSKINKRSSNIYRIPLSKVDQVIFNYFYGKKAKPKSNKQKNTLKSLEPFYRWENQGKRILKPCPGRFIHR